MGMVKLMYNFICLTLLVTFTIAIESLYRLNVQPKFLYNYISCPENIDKFHLHFNLLILGFFLIGLFFKKDNLRNAYLNLLMVFAVSKTMKTVNSDVLNFTNVAFLIIIVDFIFGCLKFKKLQKKTTFIVFYTIVRLVVLKYKKKILYSNLCQKVMHFALKKLGI